METEVRTEGAGVINLSTAGGDRLTMKSPLVNGDSHADTTTTTSQVSQQVSVKATPPSLTPPSLPSPSQPPLLAVTSTSSHHHLNL